MLTHLSLSLHRGSYVFNVPVLVLFTHLMVRAKTSLTWVTQSRLGCSESSPVTTKLSTSTDFVFSLSVTTVISPAVVTERSASLCTLLATTAKPRPCSPARAASMVALRASRLVWSAISRICCSYQRWRWCCRQIHARARQWCSTPA